ncbi:MAG: glycosyltransferase family 4 protein [Pseudomonadota bacterium]
MAGDLAPDTGTMVLALVAAGWFAATVSYFLSRLLVRLSLLPDHPNFRSSHSVVTPRAGGIAIYGAWAMSLAILVFFFWMQNIETQLLKLVFLGGLAFMIGAIDDAYRVSPTLKFAGQLVVASLFVAVFGPIETFPLPVLGDTDLGVFSVYLTLFWIVGFMNAYNFMDGVNGIASTCAIFVLSAFAVSASLAGVGIWAMAAVLLAVALSGFVPINLRHGRLFMGDNGSMSVGFVIAALAVLGTNGSDGRLSIIFVPMAFLPFLVDVMFTITHRARRGENVLSAHREHVYQLLNRLGRSHVRVTSLFLATTSLTCVGAMMTLVLPPAWQWIAPASAVVVLVFVANRVYREAVQAQLLPSAPEQNSAEDIDDETPAEMDSLLNALGDPRSAQVIPAVAE